MRKLVILLFFAIILTSGFRLSFSCSDSCSSVGTTRYSEPSVTYFQTKEVLQSFGSYLYKSTPDKVETCSESEEGSCECTISSCSEWERCENADCACVEEYCDGWCSYQAKKQLEVPVFDGPDFSGCIEPKGTCGEDMYELDYTSYRGCTCSWCSIKDFYECDSASIDDSHPCASNNCAHDFTGEKNYCCPYGSCAHVGTENFGIVTQGQENNPGDSITPNLMCYGEGTIIQYQGYLMKCYDGGWSFVGGENTEFEDNCGKTIFNYRLYSNPIPKYPAKGSWGYKDYLFYPISVSYDTKDVVAKLIPADKTINLSAGTGTTGYSSNEINKRGNETLVIEKTSGEAYAKFIGNNLGNLFNLSVDCYTPNLYPCNPIKEECWPNSHCSEDNPANIFFDENKLANPKFEIRFLGSSDQIKCYLSKIDEEGKVKTEEITGSINSQIAMGEYNVISCEITAANLGSGFDSQLEGYFTFGDEDNSKQTKPENCENNAEWKYTTKTPEGNWHELNYDDSDWETGTQPFGSYINENLFKYPDRPRAFVCLGGIYDDINSNYCKRYTHSDTILLNGVCQEVRLWGGSSGAFESNSRWRCGCYETPIYSCNAYTACTYRSEKENKLILENSGDKIYLRKFIEPDYNFFCCPNLSCSHKELETGSVECYNPGKYELNIKGETQDEADERGCLWKCFNGEWSKLGRAEECNKTCDCNLPGNEISNCVETLENLKKNICCPEGFCAKDLGECVQDQTEVRTQNGVCYCEQGFWNCMNTKIISTSKRKVISKGIDREFDEISSGFLNSEKERIKVIVFFDRGNYDGEVLIEGGEDCSFISSSTSITDRFEFESESTNKGTFDCKLEISAPEIQSGKYFFYTGTSLIIDYI